MKVSHFYLMSFHRTLRERSLALSAIFTLAIGVSLLSLSLYLVSDAEAVQIKRVQQGLVEWASTEGGATESLTYPVDTTKSIILVYTTSDDLPGGGGARPGNREGNPYVHATFETSSSISLTRLNVSAPLDVNWYVIEFADGINIIPGYTSLTNTTSSKELAISPAVDDEKAIGYYLMKFAQGFVDETESWRVKSYINTAGDSYTITRDKLPTGDGFNPAPIFDMIYRIVEFETDAIVYSDSITMNYNSLTATSTDIGMTDPSKCFLMFDFTCGTGIAGMDAMAFVRGRIDEAGDDVIFTRGTSGSTGDEVDIHWYVVELTDSNSTVQRGTYDLGTAISGSVTLDTEVDADRSFPIISTEGSGALAVLYGDILSRCTLTDTTISFNKYSTAVDDVSTEIDWQVVEFAAITVEAPDGGQTLTVGDDYVIQWTSAGSVANVKIEYNDGSTGYRDIVTSTDASLWAYTWTVGFEDDALGGDPILPADEKATDCQIRISNASDSTESDTSSSTFIIKSGVAITAPNEGTELWYVGDTERDIDWSYWGNFDSTVKLQYSADAPHSQWTDITGATALSEGSGGTGSYTWVNPIPMDASGKTTQVRIVSNTHSEVVDPCDNNFEIRGTITIVLPNAASEWYSGYTQAIDWEINCNIDTLSIYYATDGGTIYELCDDPGSFEVDAESGDADPSEGRYIWTPPLSISSNLAKIKIVHDTDEDIVVATNTFKIIPSIRINTPPNPGDVWKVGEENNILFTVGGGISPPPISQVDIYYTNDFTGTPVWTICGDSAEGNNVDVVSGANTFAWNVQNVIGADTGIRIEDTSDPTNIYDEGPDNVGGGADPFTVKGRVVINNPSTGAKINVNDNYTVGWTPKGSITADHGLLTMYYYNGDEWSTVYTGIDVNASTTKQWAKADIPIDNLNADTTRIKIALPTDKDPPDGVYGQSDTFILRGEISGVTTDLAIYNTDDTAVIEWIPYPSGNNELGNIEIRYSLNGGIDGYPDTQQIATG
ncbi:hypothetical protein ACFL0T_05420, partial [Candidatus Omnitrophota bacterium]